MEQRGDVEWKQKLDTDRCDYCTETSNGTNSIWRTKKNHEDKTDSAFAPAPLAVERLMNEVLSEEAGRGDLSDGEKQIAFQAEAPDREE